MSDELDLELRRALRDEAFRLPVRLTAATIKARLEAEDGKQRRSWYRPAAVAPVAGLALVLFVVTFGLISTPRGGPGQTAVPSVACDESPATRHGSWWVEVGGPNAFFNIEPGTRLSTQGNYWLLFARFDPDAGPSEEVAIGARRLGSDERSEGRLNSRVEPSGIYRFDEPAPSLPGGWYLFELDVSSPGCWLITGSVGGQMVGSATVDVGRGLPGPTPPFGSFVPTPAPQRTPRFLATPPPSEGPVTLFDGTIHGWRFAPVDVLLDAGLDGGDPRDCEGQEYGADHPTDLYFGVAYLPSGTRSEQVTKSACDDRAYFVTREITFEETGGYLQMTRVLSGSASFSLEAPASLVEPCQIAGRPAVCVHYLDDTTGRGGHLAQIIGWSGQGFRLRGSQYHQVQIESSWGVRPFLIEGGDNMRRTGATAEEVAAIVLELLPEPGRVT